MGRRLLVFPLEKAVKVTFFFPQPLEKKLIFPFIDMELTLFV
jgi:hypothetical protein